MQSRFISRPSCRRVPFLLCSAALLALPFAGHAAVPARGQPVQMSGTVAEVVLDDLANHASRVEYHLEDEQSHRHATLRFDGAPPEGLRTGTRLSVSGVADGGGSILLSAGSASVQTTQSTPLTMQTATTQSTASATVVSGVQNTIVIIANFTNAAVTSTPSQIQNIMFSDPAGHSIDALFRETSFGNVGFSGQVAGPFVINVSTAAACDLAGWADAADSAATASGVNVSSYPRRLYIMPTTEMSVCGMQGAGQVGGSPSRAWVFDYTVNDLYAHELGHNLNMAHASTLANVYGDASDDMAGSGYPLRHFNAPHMEQMGWMPAGNIRTITASGTYTVAALELSPTQTPAPQILKVLKPDTGDYYYFSYREPLGLDSGLRTAYWNRVNVHKYTGNYIAYDTYLLALLDDASVFSDATNGITVTQVSHASDRATVQVQISGGGTPTCQRATPVLALSPSSQSGTAGSTRSYTVSLTNNDNTYCSASSFSLANVIPSGWTGTLSPSALSLAPGVAGSATLALTSSATATAASFPATINVSDAASSAHTVSGSVAYVVQTATCTRSAPAIAFSPASQSGPAGTSLSYTVSVTNKDSSSCAASTLSLGKLVPSGWAATISPTTMSLSPGATSGATFVVTSAATAAASTYSIQMSTTDAATTTHSASGSGSDVVVVQADTQAPSAPTGLAASVSKRTNLSLTWQAATDNVGVAGYEVWRNGARVATTAARSYAEVLAGGTYSYYVVAYDAAGNRSGPSNSVSVTIKSR
ncbi:MAG TPA: NEW3 domain-containing protein [Rudaea sp.]|nr:NEW3 domain-containing protein [Rudaea sp.]